MTVKKSSSTSNYEEKIKDQSFLNTEVASGSVNLTIRKKHHRIDKLN